MLTFWYDALDGVTVQLAFYNSFACVSALSVVVFIYHRRTNVLPYSHLIPYLFYFADTHGSELNLPANSLILVSVSVAACVSAYSTAGSIEFISELRKSNGRSIWHEFFTHWIVVLYGGITIGIILGAILKLTVLDLPILLRQHDEL